MKKATKERFEILRQRGFADRPDHWTIWDEKKKDFITDIFGENLQFSSFADAKKHLKDLGKVV
jgi:hypothetical protein